MPPENVVNSEKTVLVLRVALYYRRLVLASRLVLRYEAKTVHRISTIRVNSRAHTINRGMEFAECGCRIDWDLVNRLKRAVVAGLAYPAQNSLTWDGSSGHLYARS